MSRKWKFVDTKALYFISYAVVNWIDVFVRNEYKQELIES
jgi:putative transposase